MRGTSVVRKAALAAFACFAIGVVGLFAVAQSGAGGSEPAELDIKKEFAGADTKILRVKSDVANTTIVRSSGDELIIRLTGSVSSKDHPYADIKINDKAGAGVVEANIQTGKEWNFGVNIDRLIYAMRNGFKSNAKVVVELPDRMYEELRFQTDTGQIVLPRVQAGKLDLRTDTGSITVDGYTGRELLASTDTGGIRLRGIDVSSTVELSSDTGSIDLELDALGAAGASLKSDTGSIRITMNQAAPVKVDFATDTGRTTAEVLGSNDWGSFSFSKEERSRLVGELGTGGPLIRARADTGSIRLTVK